MHLAFICLSADPTDHAHAATLSWIDALAARPEVDRLTIIARRVGTLPLRPHVTARSFRGRTRLRTLWRFYAEAIRAVNDGAEAFFVYQTGPYPVLLWPIKLVTGRPVYYWKAHPHISTWTWLSARFVATKVFTATPASLPLALPNRVITGHGIDVRKFSPQDGAPQTHDLVTVGRVTLVKRLDVMIKVVAQCTERFGTPVTLDIFGPTQDPAYQAALVRLTDQLGLGDQVTFRGVVDDLPPELRRYRLFLNFSRTALDKAVLEAMACGVPVLSTNPAVAEMLPESLRRRLIAADDLPALSEAMHRLLALSEEERTALGATLRDLVVREHNVDVLFARILREVAPAGYDGAKV